MIPEENHGIQYALEMMVDFCLQLAAGNWQESFKELDSGSWLLAKDKKPVQRRGQRTIGRLQGSSRDCLSVV